MSDDRISTSLSGHRRSTGILISVLGLAAASWLISIAQMRGMDMGAMGVATELGSLGHFAPLWITMMAAMMLPGTCASLFRQARSDHDVRAVPSFLLTYLAIWASVGLLAYATYQPHGTAAAGAVVITAGLYELTPLKRRCRDRCRQSGHSGAGFGVACMGSSIGLMAILLAISPMSILWMVVITATVVAQRMFPATWLVDIPIALAVVGLGIWILAQPSSIPGLMPPM